MDRGYTPSDPSLSQSTEGDAGESAHTLAPCILFMDSLGMHRGSMIADVLRGYLQAEWQAKKAGTQGPCDFSRESMPLINCSSWVSWLALSFKL